MKSIVITFAAISMVWIACSDAGNKKHVGDGKVLNGKWTYRSLFNYKDADISFDSLAFAAATINLTTYAGDSLKGQLLWPGSIPGTFGGLNLTGNYFYEDSTLCYFIEGFGDSTLGTAGWQYNYQGYLVPKWPEGIDQATVLVGSTVRVKKHSCDSSGNNCHPAGVVATTYMVKD
jgi:hypothetical protein